MNLMAANLHNYKLIRNRKNKYRNYDNQFASKQKEFTYTVKDAQSKVPDQI